MDIQPAPGTPNNGGCEVVLTTGEQCLGITVVLDADIHDLSPKYFCEEHRPDKNLEGR